VDVARASPSITTQSAGGSRSIFSNRGTGPPAGDVFCHGDWGILWRMNKWRYALFGWVAWKVTKRVARRKLPLAGR